VERPSTGSCIHAPRRLARDGAKTSRATPPVDAGSRTTARDMVELHQGMTHVAGPSRAMRMLS
jgi:hypothetical protein